MLGRPQITRMSSHHRRPVVPPLHRYTTVSQRQVARRIRLSPVTRLCQFLSQLLFLFRRSLRQIIRRILILRSRIRSQSQISLCHLPVVFFLAVRTSGHRHRTVMRRDQLSLTVRVSARHRQRPLPRIAIKTHGQQHLLHRPVRLFRYPEIRSAQQVNHIRCPFQSTYRIRRIVVAMMESRPVTLERTRQSLRRTTAEIQPARERTQVLQLLGRILHDQDARHPSLRLRIKRINVNAVHRRLRIHLIRNGIPLQRTLRLLQFSGIPEHILHQEIRHIQTAHAVSVMMDISPAAAISHSLIRNMIVHRQELLLHFLPYLLRIRIPVSKGNALHQVEVTRHLHAQFHEHILVPVRYQPLVSLRLTHHEYGHSAHLSVLIHDAVAVILLADGLHLLRLADRRRVQHIQETLLHPLNVLLQGRSKCLQRNIRLPQRMRINHQPVTLRQFVDKRHLHVCRLLARIHLGTGNHMVEEQLSLDIGSHDSQLIHPLLGSSLHVSFITYPGPPPSGKVNAERERSTDLSVLQELKLNLLVVRLFTVHPHDKCRQVRILSRRILPFKLQIPLERQHRSRFKLPRQAMLAILIMLVIDAQHPVFRSKIGRYLRSLKREQTLVLHHLCLCRTPCGSHPQHPGPTNISS